MSESTDSSPILAIRKEDGLIIVDIGGDIDLTCSTPLQQALLELLDIPSTRIILDLTRVPYMDSSGLASLVKLLSRTQKIQTHLYLVGLSERVQSLFDITRLNEVFDISETLEDVLRA